MVGPPNNEKINFLAPPLTLIYLSSLQFKSWGPPYLPWTLHAAVFLSGTLSPDPPKLASQFLNIKNHKNLHNFSYLPLLSTCYS